MFAFYKYCDRIVKRKQREGERFGQRVVEIR